jgi:hypothetical protein
MVNAPQRKLGRGSRWATDYRQFVVNTRRRIALAVVPSVLSAIRTEPTLVGLHRPVLS